VLAAALTVSAAGGAVMSTGSPYLLIVMSAVTPDRSKVTLRSWFLSSSHAVYVMVAGSFVFWSAGSWACMAVVSSVRSYFHVFSPSTVSSPTYFTSCTAAPNWSYILVGSAWSSDCESCLPSVELLSMTAHLPAARPGKPFM
jgi:Na+/proline symporter